MKRTPDDVLATELKRLAAKTAKTETGVGVVASVARKLPTDAFQLELQLQADAEAVLRTTFSVFQEEGDIRDDIVADTINPTVSAVVGSGFLRLNPAIVTVEVIPSGDKSTSVLIIGMAKEGLIKQHAGQKAAERIAKLLQSRILDDAG